MRAAIVVLGDFGRSPRMQYHALALADNRAEVDVIAYKGTVPLRAVSEHPQVQLHLIDPFSWTVPSGLSRPFFVIYSVTRVAAQTIRLLWLMLRLEKPDVVLVQNPPPIPTLVVGLIIARVRSARLVIDWHNFGHSMLALRFGADSWMVKALCACEMALGRCADAHLCVSRAMQTELAERWGIQPAVVFRDRPAGIFTPVAQDSQMDLLRRVLGGDSAILNGKRPAIVVCPTSWTADEDISMLIRAAAIYDKLASSTVEEGIKSIPGLLILITGRGPLRAQYETEIRRLALAKVRIQTLWLPTEDYALLMGSADLGVSCHRSASGVDLPMKIADMFGAGMPVCALAYGPCLAEQVRNGENGLLFSNAEQLAGQLAELFKEFPELTPLLKSLRQNVARLRMECWSDGWKRDAAPVLMN